MIAYELTASQAGGTGPFARTSMVAVSRARAAAKVSESVGPDAREEGRDWAGMEERWRDQPRAFAGYANERQRRNTNDGSNELNWSYWLYIWNPAQSSHKTPTRPS